MLVCLWAEAGLKETAVTLDINELFGAGVPALTQGSGEGGCCFF